MPIPSLARCLRFALLVLCAAPAAAQTPKPVSAVRGMPPKAALERLELDGFESHALKLDGVAVTLADLEGVDAVVSWTEPPEWKDATPSTTITVGFETYVYLANHVGEDASEAADRAEGIGYFLVEGNPADKKHIRTSDDRIVDSYYSSSPGVGDPVAVGSYIGVVLITPAAPSFGISGALIAGAVISALVGVVFAATLLKMKSAKG